MNGDVNSDASKAFEIRGLKEASAEIPARQTIPFQFPSRDFVARIVERTI
jgi:hypothetical protein